MAVQGKQDTLEILNEYFHSGISDRKKTVDALINALIKSGIKFEIAAEELYLTIDEAVTNAMEHGNRWDQSKSIHVEIQTNSKSLSIKIADEGEGFNTKEIEAKLNNRDILSSRGRGIYIINRFCQISWNNKGNQIVLTFKIKN